MRSFIHFILFHIYMNPPKKMCGLLLSVLDAPIQIYTVRIIPPLGHDDVSDVLNLYENDQRFQTFIISKETSRKGVFHLHIRFSIALQDVQVRKILKKSLHYLDGNGIYQMSKIKQKIEKKLQIVYKNRKKQIDPDSVWKSASYICKEGKILSSRGYSQANLTYLTLLGKSLKVSQEGSKNKREPIYL